MGGDVTIEKAPEKEEEEMKLPDTSLLDIS